jgi:hypothetical protein
VVNDQGETVATVSNIAEAVPALAAHYKANPPQWMPEEPGSRVASEAAAPDRQGPRYIKDTQFGVLRVDQIVPGQWLAYRDDYELLSGDSIAIFAACEEAQRSAETPRARWLSKL